MAFFTSNAPSHLATAYLTFAGTSHSLKPESLLYHIQACSRQYHGRRNDNRRLPAPEFIKCMRFGNPTYDDDDEDSSAYTLLIGCEPEDNSNFYEKKEPEVVHQVVLQSHLQARVLVVTGELLPGDTIAKPSCSRSQGLVIVTIEARCFFRSELHCGVAGASIEFKSAGYSMYPFRTCTYTIFVASATWKYAYIYIALWGNGDYYDFCNRVFWDDSVVAKAPKNGWPTITQSTMANLNKTDAVIDLLRHMPFVDFVEPDKAYGTHVIMKNTRIQDYRSDAMQKRIRDGDLEYYVEPIGDPLPPSCISFGNSNGRNGYNLVINTADGYVYWGEPCGLPDEPAPELNAVVQERYAENETESWRQGFNVYRPREFFALCKQRFRELRWIGLQTDIIEAVPMYWELDDADDEFKSLVRKMRRAGWPGDGQGRDWDRDAFGAALNVYSDEEDEDDVQAVTQALDDTHVY